MDNPEEFRCISLCTGYAGIELGLKRVVPSLRTVCYVEVEAFACANLVSKIEKGELDAAPIWTDIKTFDGKPFYKRVHIITAGYPCQPFSVAGKRQGTDDPRHLWPYVERIIKTVQPVWFFGENVSGHLSIGFPTVYRSLRNMGYKVEAGLFTATECGASHKRERLFILANSTKRWGGWNKGLRNLWQVKKSQVEAQRPSELANTDINGFSRESTLQENNLERQVTENKKQSGSGWTSQINGNCWPSHPGQPQYEWECPRVMVVSKSKRDGRRPQEIQQEDGRQKSELCGNAESTSENSGQAQSRLGRAVNGPSRRVDRLRLLGNGVVPQQAELAFRELIKLF